MVFYLLHSVLEPRRWACQQISYAALWSLFQLDDRCVKENKWPLSFQLHLSPSTECHRLKQNHSINVGNELILRISYLVFHWRAVCKAKAWRSWTLMLEFQWWPCCLCSMFPYKWNMARGWRCAGSKTVDRRSSDCRWLLSKRHGDRHKRRWGPRI